MNTELLDQRQRPLRDLRISVIDRCNFRCLYCMPERDDCGRYAFLNESDWLTFEEILRLARIFVSLGVTKLRLTGGEPLLRPGLPGLIRELVRLPGVRDVAMTTNGSLLARYAQALKRSGLHRLTVSLDALSPELFRRITGGKGRLETVLEGVRAAEEAGFPCVKINVVVQRGVNEEQILPLVEYFRQRRSILRFIEYMDVGTRNQWQQEHVVPAGEILRRIEAVYPLKPLKPNYYGEVASRYAFADGGGEIGFIPSVTQPFCRSCTRGRLSTSGQLYKCLFARDGVDLRTYLRTGASDQKLREVIADVWRDRDDRYSELRARTPQPVFGMNRVEMFQIGG